MTVSLHAVAYNPQLNVVRVDDSVRSGVFTSSARYKMTEKLIHDRVWSEWNVNLSTVLEALKKTVEFVGGKCNADCIVMPELTPFRKKRKKYVTPWLRVNASIFIHNTDTELDDMIAERFFSLIYKSEIERGDRPVKADDTSPGFGLTGIMFPIALSELSI